MGPRPILTQIGPKLIWYHVGNVIMLVLGWYKVGTRSEPRGKDDDGDDDGRISRGIQVPSSTHLGATYSVRANPSRRQAQNSVRKRTAEQGRCPPSLPYFLLGPGGPMHLLGPVGPF